MISAFIVNSLLTVSEPRWWSTEDVMQIYKIFDEKVKNMNDIVPLNNYRKKVIGNTSSFSLHDVRRRWEFKSYGVELE